MNKIFSPKKEDIIREGQEEDVIDTKKKK